MEEIINFIQNYWSYISVGILLIFQILTLILRKMRVKVNLPNSTYAQVIGFIRDAEKTYGDGHGKEKLRYVLERYLQQNNVAELFRTEVEYYLSNLVDDVLDTPTKKGGPGREKAK